MRVGDRYAAIEDCLNNFSAGQVVEITAVPSSTSIVVDGVAELDAEVFLQFFRSVGKINDSRSHQEQRIIRSTITALLSGLPVTLPDGTVWIYRRKDDVVYENEDGIFTATTNTLFQVAEGFTIANGIRQEKTFYIPVDIPFGDAIEVLRTITKEESAIIAANLTLRKGV